MRRYLKALSSVLFAVYLADLLMKKYFLSGFYSQFALPETAAYLFLFLSVGAFLLSIVRIDADDDS